MDKSVIIYHINIVNINYFIRIGIFRLKWGVTFRKNKSRNQADTAFQYIDHFGRSDIDQSDWVNATTAVTIKSRLL